MNQDKILALASRQHGVVRRADLRSEKLSAGTLSRWVARGLLRRLHRGVYFLGVSPTQEARWMAAVLAAGPGALLSHASAARCWALLSGSDQRVLRVTVPSDRKPRIPGVRVHRSRCLTDEDRAIHESIPVTTPARTLVDMAGDLGPRDLERMLARADRAGLASASEVARVAERCMGKSGIGVVQAVLGRAEDPAFTQSVAEDRFLDLVRNAGLRAPRTNVPIGIWEVDFLWEASGLAVEIDGAKFHLSRTSFENDRRKDSWLKRKGISVLRFTWRQLDRRPLEVVATVARALEAVDH